MIKKETQEPEWDEVKCLKCGNTWNASDDDDFNISFCYNCHNGDPKYLGGKYYDKEDDNETETTPA